MDMNDVIKYVYTNIGLNNNFIFTSLRPQDIQKYIEDNTIKTYSQYHQHTVEYTNVYLDSPINGADIRSRNATFMIPEEIKNGMAIFGINSIKIDTNFNRDREYRYSRYPMGISHGGIVDNSLVANMLGNTIPTIFARYESDRITVRNHLGYDMSEIPLSMRVSYMHSKNMKTIPEGHSESFKQLAILDIMTYLYENEFKFIDGANLGNAGSVDLKIERFKTAAQDRVELLKDWKSRSALNKSLAFYT